MQEGTIARLTDKGFGFIKGTDGSKDLFFHSNDLIDVQFNDLREGDKVSFKVESSDKGAKAANVTRL
jgi:cold shock protein